MSPWSFVRTYLERPDILALSKCKHLCLLPALPRGLPLTQADELFWRMISPQDCLSPILRFQGLSSHSNSGNRLSPQDCEQELELVSSHIQGIEPGYPRLRAQLQSKMWVGWTMPGSIELRTKNKMALEHSNVVTLLFPLFETGFSKVCSTEQKSFAMLWRIHKVPSTKKFWKYTLSGFKDPVSPLVLLKLWGDPSALKSLCLKLLSLFPWHPEVDAVITGFLNILQQGPGSRPAPGKKPSSLQADVGWLSWSCPVGWSEKKLSL